MRIAGKAVWFEPIEDDEDEEEQLNTVEHRFIIFPSVLSLFGHSNQETATGRRGTLKGNETAPNLPEGYGSTSEATGAASQGSPGP